MQPKLLIGTSLSVTPLCIGTSHLGGCPADADYGSRADQAVATLSRAFTGPINFMESSNEYCEGDSEKWIGRALKDIGGLPAGFVLATKVDPVPGSDDFSGDRVRDSVAESLERFGVDHIQLVYLHDPERISFAEANAKDGPVNALSRFREEGVIQHIGVAGGSIDLLRRYVATGIFDAVLSHNKYTLVDQSASPLLEDASARGVAFINAAPYGGGILAKGTGVESDYCYHPADATILRRINSIQRTCERHGVPMAAAAVQFSLRETRIGSTVVGVSGPERIAQILDMSEWVISDDCWRELGVISKSSEVL